MFLILIYVYVTRLALKLSLNVNAMEQADDIFKRNKTVNNMKLRGFIMEKKKGLVVQFWSVQNRPRLYHKPELDKAANMKTVLLQGVKLS